MDINAAYRAVGTHRGAADICGTTPKTVKRVVEAAGRTGSADSVVHNYPYLGSVPDDPIARAHWVTAAGRIEQHHMRWPSQENQIVGSRPRSMGEDEYAFTHYAVQRAVADLDHTLGIQRQAPGREAPGLGL